MPDSDPKMDRIAHLERQLIAERLDRMSDKLSWELRAAGLDPDYVELQVQKVRGRFSVQGDTRPVLEVDVDGKQAKLTGDDAVDALTREIVELAPAKWKGARSADTRMEHVKPRTDEQVREAQRRDVGYARP